MQWLSYKKREEERYGLPFIAYWRVTELQVSGVAERGSGKHCMLMLIEVSLK